MTQCYSVSRGMQELSRSPTMHIWACTRPEDRPTLEVYVAIFLDKSWVCIPSFSFENFHCCNAKFENRVHNSMYVRYQNSVTWVLLWEGVPPEEHQKKQSSSCSCFCVKVRECWGEFFNSA